ILRTLLHWAATRVAARFLPSDDFFGTNAMRVICPQCLEKLSIHRPAVAATRVKCRSCGHKFYAGKAEEILETGPITASRVPGSDETAAEPQAAIVSAPAETAFDQDIKAEQRAATRERRREHRRRKRVKWLVPSAAVALIAMIVVGVFFSRKPPQNPTPPTGPLFDASKKLKTSDWV